MNVMMLWAFCGLLALTKAQEICYNRDGATVIAVSLIRPNTKPPPGTETPIKGTIKMIQNYGRPTSMLVQITGLPPNTPHGFHIHEFGDTVTDGCQSTGGHYTPFNHTHGSPTDQVRHVGDLGNLYTDEDGRIDDEVEDNVVSLFGPYSVIGRAFVIHQKIDDLGRGEGTAKAGSLKTGNAGARLGCGVIFHGTLN
ncbi:uncharacterized protein [Porites lutea]|uniref:uncharacterized protein n=1 Tax=Porites lutea TaxID=51062 RepID=UPI003CC5633D